MDINYNLPSINISQACKRKQDTGSNLFAPQRMRRSQFRLQPFGVVMENIRRTVLESLSTSNMAYNYVVTAHKPTSVNACVTGYIFDHNQLLFYFIK